MQFYILITLILLTTNSFSAESSSKVLIRLLKEKSVRLKLELAAKLEKLVKDENALPQTKKGVTFLFFWSANTVEAAGEWNGWQPALHLVKSSDCDVWTAELHLPKDARLEYKLVVDGKWIRDPLTSKQVDNGLGDKNSWLAMPEYKPFSHDYHSHELKAHLNHSSGRASL